MLVAVHAALGVALLAVGLAALRAPKRRDSRHPRLGGLYVGVLVPTLLLGMAIGAQEPGVSAFEAVTPPTLALGIGGWAAVRLKRPLLGRPWLVWHVSGLAGSYIGVVTAASFQLVPRVAPEGLALTLTLFAVPSIVGSVMIATALGRRLAPG